MKVIKKYTPKNNNWSEINKLKYKRGGKVHYIYILDISYILFCIIMDRQVYIIITNTTSYRGNNHKYEIHINT